MQTWQCVAWCFSFQVLDGCGGRASIVVVAAVSPASAALVLGHGKTHVQGQPLARIVRQAGAVFAAIEAVAHVVAADDLAEVVMGLAALDLLGNRFITGTALLHAVPHYGAGGSADRGCGDPAVSLADGGADETACDGAEDCAPCAAFAMAAGLVADGFGPAFAAWLVDRLVGRRARQYPGAGSEAVAMAGAGLDCAADCEQCGDQGGVKGACCHGLISSLFQLVGISDGRVGDRSLLRRVAVGDARSRSRSLVAPRIGCRARLLAGRRGGCLGDRRAGPGEPRRCGRSWRR